MTLYYTKRCFSINSLLLKIKIMLINQKINGELHMKRFEQPKKTKLFFAILCPVKIPKKTPIDLIKEK